MGWKGRQLVEYEPDLGRATYYTFNDDTYEFAIEEVWDVDPVTEAAQAAYNQMDERASWKGDWHHVAAIPNVVLDDYKKRGIDLLRDKPALRRFLNDKDNRAFRTRPGRV